MANEPKLDCYAILEISSDVEDAAIRPAFATQLRKFRSEQFSGTLAEGRQRLADLRLAYQILIDPVQRRRYDLQRRIAAIAAACSQKSSADDDAPRQVDPAPGIRPVSATRLRRYRVPLFLALIAVALTAVGTFRYSNPRPERPAASPSTPPVAIADDPAGKTQVAPVADDMPPVFPAVRPGPPPPQEVKPADTKPVGNKVASSNRRAKVPSATPAEACGDVVAVLGLCKPKSTAENK